MVVRFDELHPSGSHSTSPALQPAPWGGVFSFRSLPRQRIDELILSRRGGIGNRNRQAEEASGTAQIAAECTE